MLSRIKLHLAGEEYARAGERMDLPGGLTVRRVLAEYLGEMGKMAVREIKSKLGAHIKKVSRKVLLYSGLLKRGKETCLLFIKKRCTLMVVSQETRFRSSLVKSMLLKLLEMTR